MANLNEMLDDLGVSQEEYEAVMDEIDVTAGFSDYDSAIMHIEQVVKNLEDKKLKGELVTDLTEWLDCRDAVEESLIITSGGMESELESEDRMLLSRLSSLIKEQGYDNMDYEFGNVLDFMDARAAELESYSKNKGLFKDSSDDVLKDSFDKIKGQFSVREVLENAFNVFEKTGSSKESLLDDRLNANRYALKEVSRILANTARIAESEGISNDAMDKLRDYAVKGAMKLDSFLPEDELVKCFSEDLDISESFGFSETVMTGDPALGLETQDEFNRILAYRMVRKNLPANMVSFVDNYIMRDAPDFISGDECNELSQSEALMEFLEENDISFAINKNITDAVSRCWLLDSYSKRLHVASRYPEFTQNEMVEAGMDAIEIKGIAIAEYDDTCQMIDDRIKALKEIYIEQGFDNIMPLRSGEEILSDSAENTVDVSFNKEALKPEKEPDKSYQITFDDVIKRAASRDIPELKEAAKDDADFGFDV